MLRSCSALLRVAGVFAAAAALRAAEPTRIYIGNDDHTDYMWATDAETYDDIFVDMLDFHLGLTEQTLGKPSPFRNRFNTDGSLWLWHYERKKSPADFARLIARIKEGYISSPLNTIVACYGGQPVEAVLRGMYYAGRLERRHGLRFPLATATENQTLPLGLASLFAGAGASYSWRGVCACASKLSTAALAQRAREIYWYAGHDGQRLLMKWYSVAQGDVPTDSGAGTPKAVPTATVPRRDIGTYIEARNPRMSIDWLETDPGFRARHVDPVSREPYRIMGVFGFGGDALARKTGKPGGEPDVPGAPGIPRIPYFVYSDHFHVVAEEKTTPQREVVVSDIVDFFKDFEARYGRTLDTQAVTFGNEWDLYSASMAETSARAKRTVEKLRAAELMATLVTLKKPDFMAPRTRTRDQAFTNLGLYWEHNWTADGQISNGARAAWQENIVSGVELYVDSLHADAWLRLSGLIARPANTQRFFVLNPLGWKRTGAADHAYTGPADIHVRDVVTGEDVPHQLVKLAGAPHLRILARDVPSAGYKVYEIRPGPGTAPRDPAATAVAADDGAFGLENAAVKLAVARDGAIRSFVDKRRAHTELAATVDGLALNDLAPNADAGEPLVVENAGPVSVTLRARSDSGLAHTTAITLYRDSDRVDIRNEITENFSDIRHWAFSVNVADPAVRTEEVGAINLNKLASQGGAYAETHARYDYVTLNHFADIADGTGSKGLTLSNADLAFAKLGRSTPDRLDTATPQLNALAGGQIDGRGLGIRGQNGATYFLQRFALRPHGGYDQVAAMRFALEHQNPFVTGALLGGPGGPFPADTFSLLSVSHPNVLLWAAKPADDGPAGGVVVRLWNLADAPATASVALSPGIAVAFRTTHIETDLAPQPVRDGAIDATWARQQLQTFRLTLP